LRKSERLKGSLEQALADWNPSRANSLSDELEEALDELERKAPKPD
jgi:ABC-type transporter Mla subunit MlaD